MANQVSFSPYGGDSIKALQLRQKALQEGAPTLPTTQNMRSPWQGASYLANTLVNTLQQNAAANQERGARTALAKMIAGHPEGTGWTNEELANMGQLDPDMMSHLMDVQAARELAEQKLKSDSAAAGVWKPSDIGSLRDDYTKAASLYTTANQSWNSMLQSANIALNPDAAQEGKGAADYDMIVGWAKMLDPNSVVRETEVDSASMTGGMISQINGWLNTIKSKGSLDDATRRAIMTQAGGRMKSYYDEARTKRDWISDIAKRHAVPPEDVVSPLPDFTPFTPPEAPPPDDTNPDAQPVPYPGPQPDNWPPDQGYPDEATWKRMTPADQAAALAEIQRIVKPPRQVP